MKDRRVHGRTATGSEVVRYDRAGKWYVEGVGLRRAPITVGEAVRLVLQEYATVYTGIPGGTRFDALVRRAQEEN